MPIVFHDAQIVANKLQSDAKVIGSLFENQIYLGRMEQILQQHYGELWASKGNGKWRTDLVQTGSLRGDFTNGIDLANMGGTIAWASSLDYASFVAEKYGLYDLPQSVLQEIVDMTTIFLNQNLSEIWS